jgi:hypothetical protein
VSTKTMPKRRVVVMTKEGLRDFIAEHGEAAPAVAKALERLAFTPNPPAANLPAARTCSPGSYMLANDGHTCVCIACIVSYGSLPGLKAHKAQGRCTSRDCLNDGGPPF